MAREEGMFMKWSWKNWGAIWKRTWIHTKYIIHQKESQWISYKGNMDTEEKWATEPSTGKVFLMHTQD
jgi:hypothetical protein